MPIARAASLSAFCCVRLQLLALGLLLVVAAVPAVAATGPAIGSPRIEVVAQTDASTTIRVVFPVTKSPATGWDQVDPQRIEWVEPDEFMLGPNDSETRLPRRALATLAVPTRALLDPVVVSWSWLREPSVQIDVSGQIDITPTSVFRDVPLAVLEVRPLAPGSGVLGEIVVRIAHRPSGIYATRLAAATRAKTDRPSASFAGSGIVNSDLFAALQKDGLDGRVSRAAASGHPFGASNHWLRMEIAKTGVYRLTGYDMEMVGVVATSVDPATLRLYQAWVGPLPEDPEFAGSWRDGWTGMREVSLRLSDVGDVLTSADSLLFYAVGPDGWRERRDLFGEPLEYVEHPYANNHIYWLTWENPGTPTPHPGEALRMDSLDATPNGTAPVTIHRSRNHFEESYRDAHGRVADNWAWDLSISSTQSYPFEVDHVVADSAAYFQAEIRSTLTHGHSVQEACSARGWVNGEPGEDEIAELNWIVDDEDDTDEPFLLSSYTRHLIDGANKIYLQRTSPDTSPNLLLDSFDIFYWRELVRDGGPLEFVHWGDQLDQPAESIDLRIATLQAGDLFCWDVTNPLSPVELIGVSDPAGYTIGVDRTADQDLHCAVFMAADTMRPAATTLRNPIDLRGFDAAGVDYVVLYPSEFSGPANQLTDFRSVYLPGVTAPRAVAFDIRDVFDSFGGGVKDPLALRNFLKWMYGHSDAGDGEALRYVCLFGDASRDLRNRLNQLEDFLPTFVRTRFPGLLNNYSYEPYATDDMLVSFDAPAYGGSLDFPDLSIGRFTVRTPAEAQQQVDAIREFALSPETGPWRNRVIITADDLETPLPKYGETFHIAQAEVLSNYYIPYTLDLKKVYLTEYEKKGSIKPGARQDLRNALGEGVVFFHYTGHGSNNTLADEQLFITDDIYSIGNGDRRFVFLAFSCDVGIYDSPLRQSMGEIFTTQAEGGAIASVTASQVSWSFPNNIFSSAFYLTLYPDTEVDPRITLGEALFAAKHYGGDYLSLANSQRYMLLGDPGLSLPSPASAFSLHESGSDSLHGGLQESMVAVMSESGLTAGPGLDYEALIQDSMRHVDFVGQRGDTVSYYIPGNITFRGTGPVEQDTLKVPFKMPVQMRYGDTGRVRLVVNTPAGSFADSYPAPVVRSDLGEITDIFGPLVDLGFEDGRYRVKAGTPLLAAIQDSSGVNILGTNPSNSVLLEFDGSGLTTDVSSRFQFDPGSYSSGRLEIPLPNDLELGRHQAAVYASDVMGNVGSDTLSFQMVAATVASIADVTLFPNPTPGPARIVFELSDPMNVEWNLYTVSGRRVRRLERNFSTAGPQILYWDGRDHAGDQIANGVYIYVMKGSGVGDGHEITETGQLVIMK